GILVALVVAPGPGPRTWEVISGHRRLACARALGLAEVPCEVRPLAPGAARRRAILEFNRQRRKTFSQLMREADALEELWAVEANSRRLANLRRGQIDPICGAGVPPAQFENAGGTPAPQEEFSEDPDCRNSDARGAGADWD